MRAERGSTWSLFDSPAGWSTWRKSLSEGAPYGEPVGNVSQGKGWLGLLMEVHDLCVRRLCGPMEAE